MGDGGSSYRSGGTPGVVVCGINDLGLNLGVVHHKVADQGLGRRDLVHIHEL